MFRLNHVFSLELGKPAADKINGRRKATIALKRFATVTCRVSKAHEHVVQTIQSCTHVFILQLCAWGGARTPQGYVKHMCTHDFCYHTHFVSSFPSHTGVGKTFWLGGLAGNLYNNV